MLNHEVNINQHSASARYQITSLRRAAQVNELKFNVVIKVKIIIELSGFINARHLYEIN